MGLACLAHNRSPPVHRYLLTRFANEWLFELHFRVTNSNVGRTFEFVTPMKCPLRLTCRKFWFYDQTFFHSGLSSSSLIMCSPVRPSSSSSLRLMRRHAHQLFTTYLSGISQSKNKYVLTKLNEIIKGNFDICNNFVTIFFFFFWLNQ